MTNQKKKIDAKAFAAEMEEKMKAALKEGNPLEIPKTILEYLEKQGVALPEKAKQAILEIQPQK